MNLRFPSVSRTTALCAVLVTSLFAVDASAAAVDNWDASACGGSACDWFVDWGVQSVVFFGNGAYFNLSDGTQSDDGSFYGTYDSAGTFSYDSTNGTTSTQWENVLNQSGGTITIAGNTLQAYATTSGTPTGALNAHTGLLDFGMTLQVNFQTTPTNKLKGGCNIEVSINLSTSNAWGPDWGSPQYPSNYSSSSSGTFKILDDAETAPAATTGSCGTANTSALNGALTLGVSGNVFGVYWTGAISWTGGSPIVTIYPTGS
jgi:hypothetical protein